MRMNLEGTADSNRLDFAVIGIGASSGGLKAMIQFFECMPAVNGSAFVVVTHLSPRHESNIASLLQKCTKMKVIQVSDTVSIEKHVVYVIAPSKSMAMLDGKLIVADMERLVGRRSAIDIFFRTLAEVHRERAVGIILSGTGSDGAVGITRIKECGGLAIAQSPPDAEYEEMPCRAIETGTIDFVLPVAEIPQKLLELTENASRISLPSVFEAGIGRRDDETHADPVTVLAKIMEILFKETGHDFSHYKKTTVLRRIERRMQVTCVDNITAYLAFLEKNLSEAQSLLQDMLIGVTNFFRDRECFEALEREAIPKLFSHFPDGPIRAWSAGVASGEEAYSIAMLLAEECKYLQKKREIQVFASDIDDHALRVAREGSYPMAIVTDVAPSRLRQFFIRGDKRYRVKDEIRERIIFASHNILRDPPFSGLHLIVCRNLLIYLEQEIQERILAMFHFSLFPGGFLFLGASETIDTASKYFIPVDKKNRIYQAIAAGPRSVPSQTVSKELPAVSEFGIFNGANRKTYAELHQRGLEKYGAPSLLINREKEIVYLSQNVGEFLQQTGGSPSHNLMDLISPELRLELRTALFESMQNSVTVVTRAINWERKNTALSFSIFPVTDKQISDEYFLVVFNRVQSNNRSAVRLEGASHFEQQLEKELIVSKEARRTIIEQYETSVEELKASNEELQAINEELRSTAEELETSKEEGQSINEELIDVNHRLKLKVAETTISNEDLQNFVAASEIATIFVERDLKIKRYTPCAANIFNLLPTDLDRPLLDITHRLHYRELEDDAAAVFRTLHVSEREVKSSDGKWYIARLLPYRTLENRIDGLVLTFVDITALHLARQRLREEEQRMQLIAASAKDYAIITLDGDGLITSWSEGAKIIFGYLEEEVLGRYADLIFTPEDRENHALENEIRTATAEGRAIDERWHLRKDGDRFFCSGVMSVLGDGIIRGFVKIARDLTDAKIQEAAREDMLVREQDVRKKAEEGSRMREEFLAILSHELKQPLNLIHLNAELLKRAEESKTSSRLRRIAEAVHNSSNSLSKIIDDLLDLSRVRTGKLILRKTRFDIARILVDIVQLVEKDAATKNITLLNDTKEDSFFIIADATRIEQVIWNLLSNAIKFTPINGLIQVSCFAQADSIYLTVKDNGKGIAAEHLSTVFDMFNQVDGSNTRDHGGLGIGLALVQQLVESHGGEARASSPGVGYGAEFVVRLPVGSEKPQHQEIAAIPVKNKMFANDIRLLLVDDNVDTLYTLSELLQENGLLVVSANSAMAGLEQLEKEEIDVVVTDIAMPGMDGYTLFEEVRRRFPSRRLPVIALSGFGTAADVDKSFNYGFAAHLNKPVDLNDLLIEIERLHKAR